ncbi:hypothetical protein ACFLY6_01695 [Candidatus Dependentiae bacterium]
MLLEEDKFERIIFEANENCWFPPLNCGQYYVSRDFFFKTVSSLNHSIDVDLQAGRISGLYTSEFIEPDIVVALSIKFLEKSEIERIANRRRESIEAYKISVDTVKNPDLARSMKIDLPKMEAIEKAWHDFYMKRDQAKRGVHNVAEIIGVNDDFLKDCMLPFLV